MIAGALPRVTSRKVSHGVGDVAGASSRLRAWWSADDWLDEVADAVKARRDLCREHHAEPDTVVAVARGMAAAADFRTGRNCRPTNERLVELVRVSLSTVQRCRRVLKALGLVVEQVAGRSFMTRSERLQAWRAGSSHRKIAAVFALCSQRARGAKMRARKVRDKITTGRARPTAVERDTPPGAASRELVSHLPSTHLRATTEQRRGRCAPAHTDGSHERRPRRLDPAARRLAEGVRRRVAWLAAVPVGRMVPTLSKFAQAGWQPSDVDRAAAGVLAARRWRVPAQLQHPAAYLAGLLRDVDVDERPGAVDELLAERDRAQRAYERRLIYGTPCPHGQPAGAELSPLRGLMACPACRSEAAAAAEGIVGW